MSKTIAIIGAGPGGLVAAKEALEAGLSPTVFEKADKAGGVWRAESGLVWDGMRANVSRHSCGFSDFPWPAGTPDFPSAAGVESYLLAYADAFGVTPCLRLNTPVQSLVPAADGGWGVVTPAGIARFDFALVASGIHEVPATPALEGMGDFGGPMIHSAAYRTAAAFRGMRVAVIGSAFSGNEIAAKLAAHGVAVTQVVASPGWVLGREVDGVPVDLAFNTRAAKAAGNTVSRFSAAFGSPALAHPALEPEGAGFSICSDYYLLAVREKKIGVRRGMLAGFEKGAIKLADGGVFPAEAAILCTGYRTELPFLAADLKARLGFDGNDTHTPLLLDRETFHPAVPGLAFSGIYRNAQLATGELQARWAAAVFSGAVPQPQGWEAVNAAAERRAASPRPPFPHADQIGFSDTLAEAFGAKPDLAGESAELLETGPCTVAQYRLCGPGAKPEAALAALRDAAARAGEDKKKTPAPS